MNILEKKFVPVGDFAREHVGYEEKEKGLVATVVVVNRAGARTGLVVDEIVGQQQILIKRLQDVVGGVTRCASTFILADGTVVLVSGLDSLF